MGNYKNGFLFLIPSEEYRIKYIPAYMTMLIK